MKRLHPIQAPERGGDSLKGGGHPADAPVPEETEIDEMTGEIVTGRNMVPGIDDPGVPGSKTNPVDPAAEPQPAISDPVPPPPEKGK